MNLLLIGYRGSGKTTIARLLALQLGWQWIDADVEVELRAGKSIAAIFADDGEHTFRDLESAVLGDLIQQPNRVVALGGGVVLRPDNRELIRSSGTVVWLKANPETLSQRLADDPQTTHQRPALTAEGTFDEIHAILERRAPLYRQCADLEVDTEGKTPAEVASEILRNSDLK